MLRLVSVLLLVASVAHADPPGVTSPQLATVVIVPPVESYRAQTAAIDGAAIASMGFDPAAGIGLYLFGVPAIHFIHGRRGRALASFGLRVGLPVLGAVTFAKLACCSEDDGDIIATGIGLGLGMLAAMTIDTAVFASGDPPRVAPAIAPIHGGAGGWTLGLRGTW